MNPTIILGLVHPIDSDPLQVWQSKPVAAMDQDGRFWDLRDLTQEDSLRNYLQHARVILDRLPWGWATWQLTAWSLEVVERALRLGHPTYLHSIGDMARRYKVRDVPWQWNVDSWPWRKGMLIPRTSLETQAAATLKAVRGVYDEQMKEMTTVLSRHLEQIEMPSEQVHKIVTAHGLRIDQKRLGKLREINSQHVESLAKLLKAHGLCEPGNDVSVLSWLTTKGFGQLFPDGVDDDTLKAVSTKHPAISQIRRYRRLQNLRQQPWFKEDRFDDAGRYHPLNHILAAPTTRSIAVDPALTGIPKELRPLIVAGPDMVMLESDFGSMEIATIAARYGDRDLAHFYNQGNAISALAQLIFAEVKEVEISKIKRDFPDAYADMKIIIYSVLYGRTARSLARIMGISQVKAQRLLNRLLSFCPVVAQGIQKMKAYARKKKQIPLIKGLHRKLTDGDMQSGYRVETLAANSPVQGLAAVIFRAASILVHRVLNALGGRLVMLNHDAFLYEVPRALAFEAREQVEAAMKQAFRELLGDLVQIRVDTDMTDLTCWNKDGHSDSFDLFLADPNFRL